MNKAGKFMALIVMIGSLRKIWPFKIDLTPNEEKLKLKEYANIWPEVWSGETWMTIGLAVVAFVAVILLDKVTHGHEHPTHPESNETDPNQE